MRIIVVGTIALSALGIGSAASAQDLVGSWKLTAFYQKVVATGEKRYPFSEKVVGRAIYAKEGTFCTMSTAAARKQAAAAPTDDERVGLFKSMYAYCGTYKVEGSKYTNHSDVAWTPGWLTSEHSATFTLEDKKLSFVTSAFKSQLDGADVVAIVEYERE